MKNSDQLNLVILHPHILYPGGASKYMLEVASRLASKKIKVIVVLTKYDKKLVEDYQNLKFIEVGKWNTSQLYYWLTLPLFIFQLKKVLDDIPDKILFPQIFPPVWWAAIYKLFSPQTKIIWMCQEPSAFIHSPLVIKSLKKPIYFIAIFLQPLLSLLDKFLINKIDYIVANSLYGQKLILDTYQRKADLYAYPSVNPKLYKPLGKKKDYIFTISRLDKQKNIDLLINAFSILNSTKFKNYRLVIGGKGTEEENLKILSKNLKIRNKVDFIGRVPENELPKIYAEAKLSVFLGENEPFGIIPVESMSCGTPVIALKCGGVVESVIDGETGLLLDNKSPEILSETIIKMLSNETKLKEMSKESRKNIVNNFSWDKTSDRIFDFLKPLAKAQ